MHVVLDAQRRLVCVRLTPANISDYDCAEELIKEAAKKGVKILAADKGYDSDSIRDLLRRKRLLCCIPTRSNRKKQIPHDPRIYRFRNIIERYFGHLKEFRRIATRYDKLAAHFLGFFLLANICLTLKSLC